MGLCFSLLAVPEWGAEAAWLGSEEDDADGVDLGSFERLLMPVILFLLACSRYNQPMHPFLAVLIAENAHH